MRINFSTPKLANQLRAIGQIEQRAAAIFASEFALLATPVDSLLVANALENLKKNRRHTQETSSSLKSLVTQLDNKYFELQENARAKVLTRSAGYLPRFKSKSYK